MPRIFLAIQPTLSERLAMQHAAAPLVHELAGRPIPAEDLHMTLCFLGEVPSHELEVLARALEWIEPLAMHFGLDQLDWWRRSGVLCLLPGVAVAPLEHLVMALHEVSRSVGLTPDEKPFRPHVTLARKVGPATAAGRYWPQVLPHALSFTAAGFALMQSTGRGDGPRYAVVRAWTPRPPGASPTAGS